MCQSMLDMVMLDACVSYVFYSSVWAPLAISKISV